MSPVRAAVEWLAWLALLGAICFGLSLTGCAAAQASCEVIRIADYACDVLTIEGPDGQRLQVSRRALSAAMDAGADSAPICAEDAGAP
jgi:hypothetical protein